MDLELAPLDTLVKLAVHHATAGAEAVMEGVMREALRMLREELRAEVKEVADTAIRLDSACAKSVHLQDCEQKLSDLARAQETVKKEVSDQKEQLAAVAQSQDALRKEGKDLKGQITSLARTDEEARTEVVESMRQVIVMVEAHQEKAQQAEASNSQRISVVVEKVRDLESKSRKLFDGVKDQMVSYDRHLAQIQLDCISRDELECAKDQMTVESVNLRNELAKAVAEDIQRLETHLDQQGDARPTCTAKLFDSQTETVSLRDELSEIRAQMQDMRAWLSDRIVHADAASHSSSRSNWETIREGAVAELERLGAATKRHVDAKFSQLQAHLSHLKGDGETTYSELAGQRASPTDNSQITRKDILTHRLVLL